MIQALVSDVYHRHWGEPSRRAHFQTGDVHMEILKWDSTVTDEGVDLYATLGSCNYPASTMHANHRAEYIMGLLPGRDEVAPTLASVGVYTMRNREDLDHGHTLPVEGDLWPGAKMNYLLITRPTPPLIPALQHENGLHVEFMQVTPIFASEKAFKGEFGVESLLDKWMASGTPFWSPNRSPNP
jgi:hypothetical protein